MAGTLILVETRLVTSLLKFLARNVAQLYKTTRQLLNAQQEAYKS